MRSNSRPDCQGVPLTPRSLICMKVPKTSQGHHVPLHIIPGCSFKVSQTATKLTRFCTLLNKHAYEPIEFLNDNNYISCLHRDKNYFPTCSHCDETEALHFKNEQKGQQVRHSSLCRAVQDGFLLSDLPDLWLLLVKLIAETQANTCLSCPISCSTTPGVTRTSSAHVVHACRPRTPPRTSSAHIVRVSSVHARMLSAPGHIIRTSSICHLHCYPRSPWA